RLHRLRLLVLRLADAGCFPTVPLVSPEMSPHPHNSPLFPYTTLFRSVHTRLHQGSAGLEDANPHFERFRLADGNVRSGGSRPQRSEEHTSELQSQSNLVCRLLLEKKKSCILAPSLEPKRLISSPDSTT